MSTSGKRAAGYVRVSRVGTRDPKSQSFQTEKQQRDAIEGICQAYGLKLARVEKDRDVSGGTMRRAKIEELIRAVEAHEIDGIVVSRLDRFARTLSGGLAAIERIHDAGGFVLAVRESINTSETAATGKLILNILLSIAQWERDAKSEELTLAKSNAIDRGAYVGAAPVGYLKPYKGAGLIVDPATAPAIREAFEMRAKGASYLAVTRMLEERLPHKDLNRGAWQRGIVTRMLASRVYVGESRQGQLVNEHAHEPIVDRELWDTVAARAKKNDPEPRALPDTKKIQTKSLLAGLVRCSSCGHALSRHPESNGFAYQCGKHSKKGKCPAPVSVRCKLLDAHVVHAFQARTGYSLFSPLKPGTFVAEVSAALGFKPNGDRTEVYARLDVARAKRARYDEDEVLQRMTSAAWSRNVDKLDAEISDIEEELAATVHSNTMDVEHALEALQRVQEETPKSPPTLEEIQTRATAELRNLLRAAVKTVTVSPARSSRAPVADRVEIEWREP